MPKMTIPRAWKFGSIPAEVLTSELSIHAKVLIGAITFHAYDDGPSFPGQARLARLCSCSVTKIHEATNELEEAGFLVVQRENGRSSSYQFLSKSATPGVVVSSQPLRVAHPTPTPPVDPPLRPAQTNDTSLTKPSNETKDTPSGTRTWIQQFVDWFGTAYRERFGKPYADSKADYIMVAQNLKAYSLDLATLKKLVFVAWNTPTDAKKFPVAEVSMTVKGFCTCVNRLTLPSTLTPAQLHEQRMKQKQGHGLENVL